MFKFFKKKENLGSIKKGKIFFHDLINHTHGMLLYLQSRFAKGVLTLDEMKLLLSEIEALQRNVQSYFGHQHKNLPNGPSLIPFTQAKISFFNLLQSYLISHEVQINLSLKGLGVEQGREDRNLYIDGVGFHRIVTNIFKNIRESGSNQVEIALEGSEDGIKFITKNFIHNIQNEDDRIKHIANNVKSKGPSGLGIESVDTLAVDLGGSYDFSIKDGLWINEIYLPWQFVQNILKSA